MSRYERRLPAGWLDETLPMERFNDRVLRKLIELEELYMALHDDVTELTADVAALTTAVNVALTELQGIVDTSTDDAAVVAANTAIKALTASLVAVEPAPVAPAAPEAPAS